MIIQFHAKNQFMIDTKKYRAFQSYQTVIFKSTEKVLYVSHSVNYSKTTSKYARQWLGDGILWEKIKEAVKAGYKNFVYNGRKIQFMEDIIL